MRRVRIESTVYEEVARTSPRRELLPNLQALRWWTVNADRQRRPLAFMHSSLRSLSVQLCQSFSNPLSGYIHDILRHSPHLTTVDIRSDNAAHDIEADVLMLALGLPQLRKIVVPMYFLTSRMATELSRIPTLERIVLASPVDGERGDREDVVDFAPVLADGCFTALKALSFAAHLQHALHFLNEFDVLSSTKGYAAFHIHCTLLKKIFAPVTPKPFISTFKLSNAFSTSPPLSSTHLRLLLWAMCLTSATRFTTWMTKLTKI